MPPTKSSRWAFAEQNAHTYGGWPSTPQKPHRGCPLALGDRGDSGPQLAGRSPRSSRIGPGKRPLGSRDTIEHASLCGHPHGRIVGYASTWFPTRAQLWNSVLSVGGFRTRWIGFVNTGRLLMTDSFMLLLTNRFRRCCRFVSERNPCLSAFGCWKVNGHYD